MKTLRVQGAYAALEVARHVNGRIIPPCGRSCWYTVHVDDWSGTDYALLVAAREQFRNYRISCPTVRSTKP